MKNKLKFIIIVPIVIVLFALLINMNETYAAGLTFTKGEVTSSGEIYDNVTYESFKAVTTTESGTSGNQNISYVKANKGSVELVAWSINSTTGITGTNVKALAQNYESKNPGYKVLAAINSDYFSTSNGLFYPINALVSNGDVIKYNNHAKYMSLGFMNDGSSYEVSKTNSVSSSFYLTIYDKTGSYPIKEVLLGAQNTMPGTNQTTFFYKNATILPATTATLFEVASPTCYFNQASIFIKGAITSRVTETSTNPIIASTDSEVIELLNNNPVIRVQKNMTDSMKDYDNILGVGSQPLKENTIQTISAIGDQNATFTAARHPRSSVGFDSDGNIIICAIDGRQTNMAGASLQEEASIMQNLGCIDCFNFDGGGSTELVIRKNDELVYLNSPSETYRSVVDALLIVVPIVDANIEINISDKINCNINTTLMTGVTFKSQDLYINGVKKDSVTSYYNNKDYELTDLNDDEANYITVSSTYTYNSKDYTVYQTKKVYTSDLEDVKPTKVKPSDFNAVVTKNGSKLEILVTCTDLSNTLTKVYVKYGNTKVIAIKGANGYTATINSFTDTSLSFMIEFYYNINSVNPTSEIYDKTFVYHIYDEFISYDIFPNEVVNDLYDYLNK